MSEGCLEGVWKLSGRCQENDREVLEGVWSRRCLHAVKKVLKNIKNHNGSVGQTRTGISKTG